MATSSSAASRCTLAASEDDGLPRWLPELALTYLAHTCGGQPIRAIARAKGCHASTILRQVRKVEAWRDDPLVDEALDRMSLAYARNTDAFDTATEVPADMPSHAQPQATDAQATGAQATDAQTTDAQATGAQATGARTTDAQASDARASDAQATDARYEPAQTRTTLRPDVRIEREARRILRRLCEKGAFLAVAPSMEKAVVLREVVPGRQNRIAVVEREIAHAFALNEWIACERAGKIAVYTITQVGRAALKRLLTEERLAREPQAGLAEPVTPFGEQHRFFAERTVPAEDGSGEQRLRFNLAESPLSVLGRKRDQTGTAYLTPDLIEAGERLREDFELAQMGPRTTQNWERFLTVCDSSSVGSRGPAEGPSDARTRVAKALEALGPGLSDIVFRVCCFIEGLETAERRLGWSARSGKVVLKIALERLARHYRIAPAADAERRP